MVLLMALTSALELAVLMASLLGLLMVDLSEFEWVNGDNVYRNGIWSRI